MNLKRFGGALIVLLVAASLPPLINTSTQTIVVSQKVGTDPGPLAKILQDVIAATMSHEYENALELCKIALNISVSQDISYYHERFYKKLVQVVNLLSEADKLRAGGSSERVRLEATIYELYISRLELGKALNDYISALSRLFIDAGTRSVVVEVLKDYAQGLEAVIDNAYIDLLQLYMRSGGGGIEVEVAHPRRVFGGDTMNVSIRILANAGISYANTTLTVVYGDVLTDTISVAVPIGKNSTLQIRVPGAENASAIGVDPSSLSSAKIFVFSVASIGNATLRGYTISNFSVDFEYPSIGISILNSIEPGKNVVVAVNASIVGRLRMYIYIDAVSTKNLIATALIGSGVNLLNISIPILAQGTHRIIFVTEPSGRYLAYSSSHAFNVYPSGLTAMARLNPFVLAPISKTVLGVYVNSSETYAVSVYVDGKQYAVYSHVQGHELAIDIDFPTPLLVKPYTIYVKILPQNHGHTPIEIYRTVYVVNIASLSALAVAISISLALMFRMGYMVVVPRLFRNLFRVVVKRVEKSSTSIDAASRKLFRRPRLAHLYKRLVSIIAAYVEPPKAWETLREFIHRLDKGFGGAAKGFVKRFFDIYEEDLYSNHVIDVEEAERLVRRVEELEGR